MSIPDKPIDIIFQDNLIVAVNKPVGIPVIPGRNLPADCLPLTLVLEKQLGKKVFVVHRIDRETSGLVLFALDAKTHAWLSQKFETREIKKTYLVMVQGVIETDGVIAQPIRQFGSGRMGAAPGGKPSMTEYHIIQKHPTWTELGVHPLTGRRHQIRVHLNFAGHPILGDPLYGIDRPIGGVPRLMLHAYQLDFAMPDRSAKTLIAPTGADWEGILSSLKAGAILDLSKGKSWPEKRLQ
jgi:tRNA pseudouridine32 synthase / 23S rRNA pseudouridine746 synthase